MAGKMDMYLILSKSPSPPENPIVNEIIAVETYGCLVRFYALQHFIGYIAPLENYVTGYACTGNESTDANYFMM